MFTLVHALDLSVTRLSTLAYIRLAHFETRIKNGTTLA
jgi:hypothetical protein